MAIHNGHCSVDGCLNTAKDMPYLTFFRIPRDVERMKIWAELIGREDIMSKAHPEYCKVCEIHFDPIVINNQRHLVSNAVPSRNLPYDSVQDIIELARSGEALTMANDQIEQQMMINDGQVMMPDQSMIMQPQPMMLQQPMMMNDEEMMGNQPIFIDMGPPPDQYHMMQEFDCENYDNSGATSGDHVISESIRNALQFDEACADSMASTAMALVTEDILALEEDFLNATPRLKCPECSYYSTEDEEQMVRHIKKIHQGINPFQCFMCDYSTYNKTIFEEHVRVHQGLKPFKCTECPHRSASKRNIKRHEVLHRPGYPLKCVKCNFLARHQRSLTFHATKCKGPEKEEDSDDSKEDGPEENKEDPEESEEEVKKVSPRKRKSKKIFSCKDCGWASSHKPKILLHLIHHPKQEVDERIDLSILKKFHIVD